MNDKKKTSGRAKTHAEKKPPVVKEVKVSEPVNEDEDKKLIVVIAIAILIIIGTVIGLLVGCQKEEDKNETDGNDTNIIDVDPITDYTTEDDSTEKYSIVRTTSSTTTTKYQITFILDGKKVYSTNIESGKKIKKYTPSGYEDCNYYGNSDLTEPFDFSKVPEDDANIYLVCMLKEYTVTYLESDGSEISSETLTGTDTEGYKVAGHDKEGFLGWSKSGNSTIAYKAGAKINVDKDLTLTAVYGVTTVKYRTAVAHVIPTTEVDENYEPEEEPEVIDEVVTDVSVPEEDDEENNSFSDTVEIAYTQEEVDNYSLPKDPSEVGLTTPTYFVPVEEETETSKKIVSDDTEEVGEKEVRISDVQGNTPHWYTPAVDDNVEEKDCVFDGWSEPDDYKPTVGGENEVVAVYVIPDEDEYPEEEIEQEPTQTQEQTSNNSPEESTPDTQEGEQI